jgi:mobilization protein MobC
MPAVVPASNLAVVAELNRIGVNLNQLTRLANNGRIRSEDLKRLLAALSERVLA